MPRVPDIQKIPVSLLEVRDLTVEFDTDDGIIRAVDGVSFHLQPGEVLGLVGESGCGKSVTAMSIPRLIPQPPGRICKGEILFSDEDLLQLPISRMRQIRGKEIGVIFQEPMTALSPLQRIERQLAEVFHLHTELPAAEIRARSLAWLEKVGISDPERCLRCYPYELSGGMRQRVMIAMALLLQPKLVIADEPTTALDVTIQAQILALLLDMRREDTGLLLITHDMGVIWEMCDRVAVMYASHIVETAPVKELFEQPLHPYTQGLLASIPSLHHGKGPLPHIPGQVPSLLNPPKGCPFADRCPKAVDQCRQAMPPLQSVNTESHQAACWCTET
ncbi:MAG: ABC transporter ATP-binding protein [Lentisphaerae bacterium]|jgi:peptide/nickel transport system ATP-binding protein/oligopeptide transport system ATP-binding protein|nr:ABC transporter ATP-binding protein [Lentisphaerota bacterium]